MRKATPPADMQPETSTSLMVQSICASWRKETRGARYATARNQLPKALLVPNAAVCSRQAHSGVSGCWHKVCYSADDLFKSPSESLIEYDPGQYGYDPHSTSLDAYHWLRTPVMVPLTLLLSHSALRVELRGLSHPARHDKTLFMLEFDQYGRIEFNRRLALYEDAPLWLFEHWVVNIGLFLHAAPDRFICRGPDREYVDLARLYYNS